MGDVMFYVWLIVVILLAIVELMTINLTTIWFVISGLAALGLSFITKNFLIQFACFVILGIVLLIISKPFVKKFLEKKNQKTNLDRIIGMNGLVTKDIDDLNYGEVKVDGKIWTAYADEKIKKDEKVEILEINGSKIKVRKVVK